ncbi:LacI family DNA-binding transcriptional regulator [Collinsella sp. AGMB00827]|uniref:LacI family DNA-binding transcriptional regulator n=1 Tax=Collinsella ureilytica TaxID=2869515 RepID=A0ABS7MI70_9ACTN|nr:PfkB family carbohydrate kinase [Collinsella urealyticum]MBY4797058.1 LacI family DNA-binding transcriptional regulator [Collinsella urealyticum]
MDIKAIAKLAGISPSTVSKILNHKDASISEKTRERVLDVVRRYRYEPYARARAPKEWMVSVIFRSSTSLDSTLDGILRTCQAHGYTPLVYISDLDHDQECHNIQSALRSGSSGIIWEPLSLNSLKIHQALFNKSSAKLITIGPSGGEKNLLRLYKDAAYSLTMELVSQGHKQVACLSAAGRRTPDFIAGFQQCLVDQGLAFGKTSVFHEPTDALLDKIGSGAITGVVCSHYESAKELKALLKDLHYHAPDDYSIASLRNDEGAEKIPEKGEDLSSYTIKNADFGAFICEKLIARMRQKDEPTTFTQELVLNNQNTIASPSEKSAKRILVIGNINIETCFSTPDSFLKNSHTLATASSIRIGGHGARQAIMVSQLGHKASLIGNVGDDSASDSIFRELDQQGINADGVHRRADYETGRSVLVLSNATNVITTTFLGANSTLSAHDLEKRRSLFDGMSLCLVQGDIPVETMRKACEITQRHGIKTIVTCENSKIAADLPLHLIDWLIIDSSEDNTSGKQIDSFDEVAQVLQVNGARSILLLQSNNRCMYLSEDSKVLKFEINDLKSVSITDRVDRFVSTFASCIAKNFMPEQSIKEACGCNQ